MGSVYSDAMEERTKFFFLILAVVTVAGALAIPVHPDSSSTQHGESGDSLRLNHSQVLIIGAGPAGVAAASRLLANGVLKVTILEAEDRLGGRVHSVPFGDDVVDLGAQWVHGVQGNVVYEMAKPLGLLEQNVPGYFSNVLFVQGNGQPLDTNLIQQLIDITERIRNEEGALAAYNGSFGQLHDEKFAEYTSTLGLHPLLDNAYQRWAEKLWSFADGNENWYDLSTKGFNAYWECPGDQMVNWKNNGYYNVINLLTKSYPDPTQELPVRSKTHFRTEAKTIHWGPNRAMGPSGKKVVLVETSDGARYTADIVLVTVSLGVLKENAATMFNPPLPDRKMNAIQNIGFGQVDKLLLHFNETWWPKNVTGFSIIPTNIDRLQFNRQYPQYLEKGEWTDGLTGFFSVPMQPRHVLFDWIVGEPARNMEKYSDEEVKNGCLDWLRMSLNRTIPEPATFARSKWYSNPHFRGSYSFRNLNSEKNDAQPAHLAEPLKGQDDIPEVLFAGEATSDHHFSTVHGAIETGYREADRILNLLGKENSSRKPTTTR